MNATRMPSNSPASPMSAEDMRRLILRSRALGESEARLAAAIDAEGEWGQPQEDAFQLPQHEAPAPSGKL